MSILSAPTASELNVMPYLPSIATNPSNVYYARYSSTNVSPQQAQWNIQSPNKRNLLLAYAQVEWRCQINKQESATAALFDYPAVAAGGFTTWSDLNVAGEVPGIAMGCPLPFANAMSSITVSINGTTQTMSQPRNFMRQLTQSCITKEEASKCFETGYDDSQGGIYSSVSPGQSHKVFDEDKGRKDNESKWQFKALTGAGQLNFRAAWGAAAGGTTFTYTEPLMAPPFNPFQKVKGGMPAYMPWGNMSDTIPHVDRLEVDIQFQKLAESLFETRFLKSTTALSNSRVVIQGLAADLLLYWYEMPVHLDIPASIDLQSFQVREFSTPVAGLTSGAIANPESQLIQLRAVPSFIMLSCVIDKDVAAYDGTALSRADDNDGAAVGGAVINARDNIDYNCSFDSIEVLLGDRPLVIGTSFSQAELYYLTIKNSKYPYPYSFQEWLGRKTTQNRTAVGNTVPLLDPGEDWLDQRSRCVVLLRPKDLSEKISDGVFSPTTLQFRTTVRAKSGYAGFNPVGARDYRLFVHVFDSKSFLRMETDRAQFQLQSVSLEAARAATQPVLSEGSGLNIGGSLSAVRDKYQPRIL